MFTTCAFCNTSLGRNDAIEQMPVGRRLAFDARRGRLWVVCRECERWNIAPTEERWDAIEACERAYRGERVRVQRGEIGLARLRDGTELVRIGAPLFPEFAAWRYGDQFRRRQRKAIALGAAGVTGAAALAAGAVSTGIGIMALMPLVQLGAAVAAFSRRQNEPSIEDPAGGTVRPYGAPRLVSAPDAPGGWGLNVPFLRHSRTHAGPEHDYNPFPVGTLRLTGADAERLLLRWAVRLNPRGASAPDVRRSVELTAEAGGPAAVPAFLARHRGRFTARQAAGDSGELLYLPTEVRLALEMSVHEDRERAALAGELAALETAWQRADEEADIGDALITRTTIEARLAALKAQLAP
ncbi:MAG: hypothetical protein MUF00_11745 [Gemmatimonadaceae bacterium]|nr:hypothetical protein [Gemmatimonadaceae bacterium]